MTAPLPRVSLVVPCRNEERYIARCLESLLAMEYPMDRLEIIVVDGRSDDHTREIISRYQASPSPVQLVDNPRCITATALNLGIRASTGDLIMITGAHTEYPAHYLRTLVAALDRSGADAVGGRCEAVPGNATPTARAIAAVLSHPFGVGNSHFRIGTREARWVDTVPFGCYRRELFERFGVFDEELVRNQDDEFNLRILRGGARLLLVPEACCRYFTRETFSQLARMYYQYGLFKPLVAAKVGRVMTLRQVVPALLVLAVVGGAILAPWSRLGGGLLVGTLGTYLLADLLSAIGLRRRGVRATLQVLAAFPVVHFSYGVGYLVGSLNLLRGRGPASAAKPLPLSR